MCDRGTSFLDTDLWPKGWKGPRGIWEEKWGGVLVAHAGFLGWRRADAISFFFSFLDIGGRNWKREMARA